MEDNITNPHIFTNKSGNTLMREFEPLISIFFSFAEIVYLKALVLYCLFITTHANVSVNHCIIFICYK